MKLTLLLALLGCGAGAEPGGGSNDDRTVEATKVWSIDDGPAGRWIAIGSTADGYGVASHVCPNEVWWYELYDLTGSTLEFASDGQFYFDPVSQIEAVLSAPCEVPDCAVIETALLDHDDIASAVCGVASPGCLCRYERDEQSLTGTWSWNAAGRVVSLTITGADHPGPVYIGFDAGWQSSDATATMLRGGTMLIRVDLDRLTK